MRRLIVLVGVVLFLCAGPARADVVTTSLRVAHDYWGRSPSCPIQVLPEPIYPSDSALYGDADIGGCRMWINTHALMTGFRPTLSNVITNERYLCVMVTHEYGHLLGYQHTATGIMDPSPAPRIVPGCQRAFSARWLVRSVMRYPYFARPSPF